jgi:hypothetical protein
MSASIHGLETMWTRKRTIQPYGSRSIIDELIGDHASTENREFAVGGKLTDCRQNDAWAVSTISRRAFHGGWAISMTMSVMSSC